MLGSSSDIDFMLADAGVPVLYAGTFAAAIVDQSDVLSNPDTGLPLGKRVTQLLLRSDALTTELDIDASITVWPRCTLRRRGIETIAAWGRRVQSAGAGTAYSIRWFDTEDDGQLTRVHVVKA